MFNIFILLVVLLANIRIQIKIYSIYIAATQQQSKSKTIKATINRKQKKLARHDDIDYSKLTE